MCDCGPRVGDGLKILLVDPIVPEHVPNNNNNKDSVPKKWSTYDPAIVTDKDASPFYFCYSSRTRESGTTCV